jgi:hypothetical protein
MLNGLVQIRPRMRVVVLPSIQIAPVIVGIGLRGIRGDGPGVIGERLRIVARILIENPAI